MRIGVLEDGVHREVGEEETILAALGLDHTELIYRLQGRPERPTVNEGEVVEEVFA